MSKKKAKKDHTSPLGGILTKEHVTSEMPEKKAQKEYISPINKLLNVENITDAISLSIIYYFIFSIFKLKYLLLETFTTGGDMGSHMYPARYMADYLLPNLKITGWSMAWYAGFPIFEFYFPLPFVFIGLSSYIIGFKIAFKIFTAAGVILLPLASYISFRKMQFRYPSPIIAAAFSLCMIFDEGYSMWGGNIKSTLAGQFTFNYGILFTVLFFGFFYNFVEKKKDLSLSGICLAAIPLCHIYTLIWAVPATMVLAISKTKNEFIQRLNRMSLPYLIGFLLSAFWVLRLIFKFQWSTPFGAWRSLNPWEIVSSILVPFYPLALLAMILYLVKPRRNLGFIIFTTLVPISFYAILHLGKTEHLLDVRFMPFAYLGILFLSAETIAVALRPFRAKHLAVFAVIFMTIFWVNVNTRIIPQMTNTKAFEDYSFTQNLMGVLNDTKGLTYSGDVDDWVSWNYMGYESIYAYKSLDTLMKYLDSLPYGRVVHEFHPSHSRYGTPRTFELIPFFTKHPVLEGLNIESSISSPYHFIMQSEYSEHATCPMSWMRCSRFDIDDAVAHFRYFAPRYVVASSNKLIDALDRKKGFTKLSTQANQITIYEIDDPAPMVEVPRYYPVGVQTDDWRNITLNWWRNIKDLDKPIVPVKDLDTLSDERFKHKFTQDQIDLKNLPYRKTPENCTVNTQIENEKISFDTNCVGEPHLIKVSYNPGWNVEGADCVYLVSPSFMLVYPDKTHVVLSYTGTDIDLFALLLTYIGFLILIIILALRIGVAKNWIEKNSSIHQITSLYKKMHVLEINLVAAITEKKRYIPHLLVLIFLVACVSYLEQQVSSKNELCQEVCVDSGYQGGHAKFPYLLQSYDHFDLGYANKQENIDHNLKCLALCDESRPDFVYVNFGEIHFDLDSKEGKYHRLKMSVYDSYICRKTTLSINGERFTDLYQGDVNGWVEKTVIIPPRYFTSDKTRISLSHTDKECWGFDVSDVWLESIDCGCDSAT